MESEDASLFWNYAESVMSLHSEPVTYRDDQQASEIALRAASNLLKPVPMKVIACILSLDFVRK